MPQKFGDHVMIGVANWGAGTVTRYVYDFPTDPRARIQIVIIPDDNGMTPEQRAEERERFKRNLAAMEAKLIASGFPEVGLPLTSGSGIEAWLKSGKD